MLQEERIKTPSSPSEINRSSALSFYLFFIMFPLLGESIADFFVVFVTVAEKKGVGWEVKRCIFHLSSIFFIFSSLINFFFLFI